MLRLLETIKDSTEAAVDSATVHLENSHRLVGGYIARQARRITSLRDRSSGTGERVTGPSIYDVMRGVNREFGAFGTDVFEIIDDARARRLAERDRS
ncbi:hypothetical protein [Salinisphaera sp. Q1T1-3]|uniref:hypothetical protein n=1 Tax=Salinisphaera sp. Q1T1-3 TaxID=2321229 RepID=UPI000E75654B|nr:hypothetical protein [Salinisphaera sp. Q1T1-3]RJS94341.1 hypothetical protein D3260_04335 [Salinisphaera sp. Q1T1-3]